MLEIGFLLTFGFERFEEMRLGLAGEEKPMRASWSLYAQTPEFLAATRMASLNDSNVETIVEELGLEPGMRVLEVGCGSGEYCFKLGKHVEGLEFTGVDLDVGFIEFCRMRARGEVGYPFEVPSTKSSYRFMEADGLELPFDDCSFDSVISHTYLTAVPDWRSALHEMKRVCKVGGTVSSVTSLTDDFYGTGSFGLLACELDDADSDLVSHIALIRSKEFPFIDLVGGIAPRYVPKAFCDSGMSGVRCRALGHYFCLSDALLPRSEYLRHIDLLLAMEKRDLEQLMAIPAAANQLTPSEWDRYAQLLDDRHGVLAGQAGQNLEWNWYGNSSLLVIGEKRIIE